MFFEIFNLFYFYIYIASRCSVSFLVISISVKLKMPTDSWDLSSSSHMCSLCSSSSSTCSWLSSMTPMLKWNLTLPNKRTNLHLETISRRVTTRWWTNSPSNVRRLWTSRRPFKLPTPTKTTNLTLRNGELNSNRESHLVIILNK